LDTVSRQIFGDIQETQFSGSNKEVHVHLKNAFQAELETEGSRLSTIFGLPPTPRQGGVMWIEDYKRSDAIRVAWIYLIQSNTTHCAKLGLMRAQERYIDTSTAQVTAPGLFGGFSFSGLKKLKGGDS